MNSGSLADRNKRRQLLDRLCAIESRLVRLADPDSDLSRLEARLAAQREELRAMHARVATIEEDVKDMSRQAAELAPATLECLRDSLERNIPLIEDRMKARVAVHAESRVTTRMLSLESEVAGQRDALQELQECSLHAEQTMQKLLQGIERFMSAATPS